MAGKVSTLLCVGAFLVLSLGLFTPGWFVVDDTKNGIYYQLGLWVSRVCVDGDCHTLWATDTAHIHEIVSKKNINTTCPNDDEDYDDYTEKRTLTTVDYQLETSLGYLLSITAIVVCLIDSRKMPKTSRWSYLTVLKLVIILIQSSFVCIAVYTVDSTISYVTNMGKYMYVKHNEPRLIIAGNIVVCSPYMEFPYSAIISAASTALSMLAAFYIVFAEICTCPCKAMCASCCKACGTRGCARICTVHVDETNKNGDPDRQHLINSEPEVSQWSYGEEDAVFQCCTYRIVYANNKKAEPDVST